MKDSEGLSMIWTSNPGLEKPPWKYDGTQSADAQGWHGPAENNLAKESEGPKLLVFVQPRHPSCSCCLPRVFYHPFNFQLSITEFKVCLLEVACKQSF